MPSGRQSFSSRRLLLFSLRVLFLSFYETPFTEYLTDWLFSWRRCFFSCRLLISVFSAFTCIIHEKPHPKSEFLMPRPLFKRGSRGKFVRLREKGWILHFTVAQLTR